MTVKHVNPVENIFTQDLFNIEMPVGISKYSDGENKAGNRIMLMCSNHPDEVCKSFYLVDEFTREKFMIEL